jgi:hypothetical protein
MDNYASGGVGAVSVLVLGLLYKLYQIINHRRIRSNCCGKIFVVAIDIDSTSTTPRQNQILPEQSLIKSDQPVINQIKVPELSAKV